MKDKRMDGRSRNRISHSKVNKEMGQIFNKRGTMQLRKYFHFKTRIECPPIANRYLPKWLTQPTHVSQSLKEHSQYFPVPLFSCPPDPNLSTRKYNLLLASN